MGLEHDRPHRPHSSSIRRIPNIVLACALGHAYGPQPERGVFRTTDGGTDLDQDAVRRREHRLLRPRDGSEEPARCSSPACGSSRSTPGAARAAGPGSGLFMSRDGGATWTRLRGQRPADASRSARSRVGDRARRTRIASTRMIETGDGVPWKGQPTDRGQLWRSEDGGDNWQVVSYDRNAMGRAHYYSRMAVAPDNENEAYFLTASYSKSHRRRRRRIVVQQRRRGARRRPSRHLDRSDQRQPPDRRARPGAVDHA